MDQPCFYRISVKAIVVDEQGRFMLAQEEDGWWDMIGGGLEHGEDARAALVREIQEETGLAILSVSEQPVYFITGPRRNHPTYVANVIYEVTLSSFDFVPSGECQKLEFFTPDEARKLQLFPTVKNFVEIYDPQLHPYPRMTQL